MRITNITTYNLYFDYPGRKGFRYAGGQVTSRVTSIIRVDTDSGQVGWGAAYAATALGPMIALALLAPLQLDEARRARDRAARLSQAAAPA